MGKVTFNKAFYQNIDIALKNTLNEFIEKVNEDEVVPFDTGTLQGSANVDLVGTNKARLTYSRLNYKGTKQVAAILYFHPEKEYNTQKNKNAQARWLDNYISNPSLIENILINNLNKLF